MNAAEYIAVFSAFTLAALSPGPNVVMAAALTMSRGRPAGWMAGAGVISANLIFALLAIYGMAFMVLYWPSFTDIVRLVGGAFLLWFAWKLWITAKDAILWQSSTASKSDLLQAYSLGLLTNLSNPKSMTFFFSLFAVLVPPTAGEMDRLFVLLGCGIINIIWYFFFVALVGSGFVRQRMEKVKFWLNRSAALFLGCLGIWMIASFLVSN